MRAALVPLQAALQARIQPRLPNSRVMVGKVELS